MPMQPKRHGEEPPHRRIEPVEKAKARYDEPRPDCV